MIQKFTPTAGSEGGDNKPNNSPRLLLLHYELGCKNAYLFLNGATMQSLVLRPCLAPRFTILPRAVFFAGGDYYNSLCISTVLWLHSTIYYTLENVNTYNKPKFVSFLLIVVRFVITRKFCFNRLEEVCCELFSFNT